MPPLEGLPVNRAVPARCGREPRRFDPAAFRGGTLGRLVQGRSQMGRGGRFAVTGGAMAVLCAGTAAGVAAKPKAKPMTRDRIALRAVHQHQDPSIEHRIDALMRKMTL